MIVRCLSCEELVLIRLNPMKSLSELGISVSVPGVVRKVDVSSQTCLGVF